MPYSLLIHGIAFLGLFILSIYSIPVELPRLPMRSALIPLYKPRVVTYLPLLKSGGQSKALPEDSFNNADEDKSTASVPVRKGLSYPGPQPILSDFPEPTNLIQTILQPELENPPILIPPLPLPNLVQIADVDPVLQNEPEDAVEPLKQKPAEPTDVQHDMKAASASQDTLPQETPQRTEQPEWAIPPHELTPNTTIDLLKTLTPVDIPQAPLPLEAPLRMEQAELVLPPQEFMPKTAIHALKILTPAEESREVMPPEVPLRMEQPEWVLPPQQAVPLETRLNMELAKMLAATPPQNPGPSKDFYSSEPSQKLAEPSTNLEEATTQELFPLPRSATEMGNLLALTPMPALPEQSIEFPYGEARGRFTISPEPNLGATETEPGWKIEVFPAAVDTGKQSAALDGDGTDRNTAGKIGNSTELAQSKDSLGQGGKAAQGSRSGSPTVLEIGTGKGAGSGSQRGPFAGITIVGAGSGAGENPSPGITIVGAGSGTEKESSSGITIVGGTLETRTASGSVSPPTAPRPLQTAYGLTIISTEASGGGLPYYGVFSNQQIYTVYLDMRKTELDPTPSWTLEYGLLPETEGQMNPANNNEGPNQQGLVLPFPITKEPPSLPPELVRRFPGKMIVVYSVININGKMEKTSVKESPDVLFDEPVLNALSKWTFRPARLNGKTIPIALLLGIPLWAPE